MTVTAASACVLYFCIQHTVLDTARQRNVLPRYAVISVFFWEQGIGWAQGIMYGMGVHLSIGRGNFERERGGPLWSIGTLCREQCKNGWTDRDAIWVMDLGGSKKACIRWGPDPPCQGGIIRGKDMPGLAQRHPSVSCPKMAEPINLPFGLWTPVGRRKHKFNHIPQLTPMSPHEREYCGTPTNLFSKLLCDESRPRHIFS